jgi:hypothetical protein
MRKLRVYWRMHPEKDEGWYARQRGRMTEDEVARELDIGYALSVTGRVFTAFREHPHVVPVAGEVIPWLKPYPVVRVWDFGKTNCVLYVQQDNQGRVRVLHERVLTESTDNEQLRVALLDSARYFDGATFEDVCDPAGSYSSHNAGPSIAMLEAAGFSPEYEAILRIPSVARKRRGIQLIQQQLQASPGGEAGFSVVVGASVGCPVLKAAMLNGYRYKADRQGRMTDKILEQHPYEDVVDALMYYFLTREPSEGGSREAFKPWYGKGWVNPITGY